MNFRVITRIVAALGGMAVVLAAPSSARVVPAEVAGATTTIYATHTGSAELVLYDDATISPKTKENPDIEITGRGRIVGFELRGDDTSDSLGAVRFPAFAGGQVVAGGSTTPVGSCAAFPDDTAPVEQSCSSPTPRAFLLHEGYYHLFVLTDGSPVTITLHLHGEEQSSAQVRLQRSHRSLEAGLPEDVSMGANTISYGTDVDFTGATQTASVVAAKLHPDATLLARTECLRADQGAAPPYAFSPACPGGASNSISYQLNLPAGAPGRYGVVYVASFTGGGSPNGLGGSFTDSDGPRYVGGVGVWIAGDELTLLDGFTSSIS